MMKVFCQAKDIKQDELMATADECGVNLPKPFLKNFMNFGDNCKAFGKMMKHGCGDKQAWKGKRAINWTNTEETVHEITPGQTILPEIWVQNGTHWPWK